MNLNLKTLFPGFLIGAQLALFLSIESWEVRLALLAVAVYQIWTRSGGVKNH